MAEVLKTVKPSGGDYTSLSAWEAGEQTNLVLDGDYHIVECYAMADTSPVSISGWTTGVDNYILVTVPTSERHSGVWDTNKYYINRTNGSGLGVFDEYVTLEGLQVTTNSRTSTAFIIELGESNCKASYCIAKGDNNSSYAQVGIQMSGSVCHVWNCIVYDIDATSGSGNRGIKNNATNGYIYSCTVIDCYWGIMQSGGSVTAKNCYAGDASNADYEGSITKTTCASSDATGSTGLQNIAVNTTQFVNVSSGTEDFRLPGSGSALHDAGTDTSGDSAPLDFTDDIDGDTRSGTWDIGADEFVAAGGAWTPRVMIF